MKKIISFLFLLILLSNGYTFAEEGNNCILGDADEDG
jgi:hypothetical protein